MKLRLLLTMAGAIGLIGCSGYEQVATKAMEAQVGAPGATESAGREAMLEGEIHAGINEYRATIGKEAVRRHGGLDALAREHSEFMMLNSGKFDLVGKRISHYGFSSRAARARNEYNMGNLAENVIAGWKMEGPVAENFVEGWVDSPNHLHNIQGGWVHTGVGVVIGPDGAIYATQLFGVKNTSYHEKFGMPGVW